MKITVYHTAFAHHGDSIPTREFDQPKGAIVRDPDELLEAIFAATNKPPEFLDGAEETLLRNAKNTGRVYSQSVGDLVLIEASNCKGLWITAGEGFKLIGAAKDARRALNDLLATYVLSTKDQRRTFWEDFARLHEAPDVDPIALTEEAFKA